MTANHAAIRIALRFIQPAREVRLRSGQPHPTCMPGRRTATKKHVDITEGAFPAEELKQEFPSIGLPIQPPFPPMEAKAVAEIPQGEKWAYEPKWDGFRCLAFRKGSAVLLQSKAGQPLGRYFPEMVQAIAKL